MAPAAYHRHQEVFEVTHTFVVASTRLLLLGMVPLAVALCFDFYLIGQLILEASWARALSWVMFAVLLFFWEIFPRSRRLHRALAF
jgi:hypothetical protein